MQDYQEMVNRNIEKVASIIRPLFTADGYRFDDFQFAMKPDGYSLTYEFCIHLDYGISTIHCPIRVPVGDFNAGRINALDVQKQFMEKWKPLL